MKPGLKRLIERRKKAFNTEDFSQDVKAIARQSPVVARIMSNVIAAELRKKRTK